MANYRFNKSDREGIVARATEAAFKDRSAAIKAEEHALGIACYEHLFDAKMRKQAAAMPKGWLADDRCLKITFGFRRATLWLIGDGVRVPSARYGCSSLGTIEDQALNDRFTALETAKDELKADAAKATANLTAMLDRFSSFNALAEAWPEGREFYAHLTPKESAPLPAVQIEAINEMLGIKLAA